MTREQLFDAIGGIDAQYLTEPTKKTRRRLPSWAAAAACLALVCAIGVNTLPAAEPEPPVPMPTPAPDPNPGRPILRDDPPADVEYSEPQIIPVDPNDPNGPVNPPVWDGRYGDSYYWVEREEIHFNQLSELTADRALRNFDWEIYEYRTWTEEEIEEWFGQDLSPFWVPEGLETTLAQTIIAPKGGEPEVDMISWLCYDSYDEYGPANSGGIPAPRGFDLTASRLGYAWGCCLYTLPEDQLDPTMVGDTEVIFGQRQMPYGPYDPETKEPAGTYTLCTAEFTTREGVECSLVSHQLEPDEVVQIVYSLLCDAHSVIIREE